ncbi:hypothetical protein JCM8547_005904 [Rhodosporidiobolus lusitaniae]
MANQEYDFAAHTTIGERAPAVEQKKPSVAPLGPSFAVPAKLEPFVLLAKSARGGGAAALVIQAVGAPGVYVFSELLEQQSIKDLATSEQHQQQYRLLELFAYGTWGDYVAKRDDYPTLTAEQETKLKQLTILTLATQSRSIPYSTLLSTLSLPDVPALEDLLISAFYADVLTGRLDQKAEVLEVLSAHGRDVRASPAASTSSALASEEMQVDSTASTSTSTASAPSVAELTASLTVFLTRIQTLMSSLDAHLATLHAANVNTHQSQLLHEERVKSVIDEVHKADKSLKNSGGGGGWKDKLQDVARGAANALAGASVGGGSPFAGGGGEGMDVDQPAGGPFSGRGAGGSTRSSGGGGSGAEGRVPRKRGRA